MGVKTTLRNAEWLSVAEAARRIGRSVDVAARIARSGAVLTRQFPGSTIEINAKDWDRLIRESTNQPRTVAACN